MEDIKYVGNRKTYGKRSPVVESSHHLSNPILNGKMQTLNENDDDDDSRNIFLLQACHMATLIANLRQ
ncbi:hypothetical protein E2C01_067510 [Portunus trituberculatus]|uniref:Uncharacterized protein n=1 Tax=Portunus trituberculatus TaxID=210409 RepID=A0A5B7HJZ9_PORTR|nr:hypothetical protein [Portunus trituberculatus]